MSDAARTLDYLRRHPDCNLRRYEILDILVAFANTYHGATPSERKLHEIFETEAPRRGYRQMHYSTFLSHMRKLKDDGLIQKAHGTIIIPDSTWKAPKHLPLPTTPKKSFRPSKIARRANAL